MAVGTSGFLTAASHMAPEVPVSRTFSLQIVELNPPSRATIRTTEGRVDATVTWSLEPLAGLADVTRVTVETSVRGRGMFRVAERMFGLLTSPESSKGLIRLKDLLESGRPSVDRPREDLEGDDQGQAEDSGAIGPAAPSRQPPGETLFSGTDPGDVQGTIREIRRRRLVLARELRKEAVKVAIVGSVVAGAVAGSLVGWLFGPEMGAIAALLVSLCIASLAAWM